MPTPRGGGIAIAIILIAGFALARLWTSELDLRAYLGFLLGAMVVASISVIDDLFTLSAKMRLLVHLLAAIVFVAMAGYVNRIYLPFIGNWKLEFGIWDLGIGIWDLGLAT